MRLICPNCGAQYEVDEKVIPSAGRDVQCSNCGHTWFQNPARMDNELSDASNDDMFDDSEEDSPPPAMAERPRARSLDPDIANVLREEAQREADARRKAGGSAGAGIESQPELELNDNTEAADLASDRSAAARARMARLRGGEENDAEAAAALAAAAATGARRDLLPDIEEINSTLRASQDRTREDDAAAGVEIDAAQEKKQRGGFRFGFGVTVIGIAAAIAVYAFSPQISQAVPQTEPYLIKYVTWANTVRTEVNGGVDWLVGQVNGLIDGGDAAPAPTGPAPDGGVETGA